MTNLPTLVTKAMATTGDATEWVQIEPGDALGISIGTGISNGVVNIERSFDGSTALGNIVGADGTTTDFSEGIQMNYKSDLREWIRVKATTIVAGSATAYIKRN